MNMKQKTVAVLLTCALLVGSFASCDSKNKGENSTQATTLAPQTTVQTTAPDQVEVDQSRTTYDRALLLLSEGEIEQAYELFQTIKDYEDVPEYLSRFSYQYQTQLVRAGTSLDTFSYTYDPYGRPTSMRLTTSNGNVDTWFYEYDENGNLTKSVFQYAADWEDVTWYDYDQNQRPIRMRCSDGFITELAYDEKGNMIRKTVSMWDWIEDTVEYLYDANGNCVQVESVDGRGLLSLRHIYEYDPAGNRVKATVQYDFADGIPQSWSVTTTEYDENGRFVRSRTEQSDGYISTDEQEYDDRGNPIKRTFCSIANDVRSGTVIFSFAYDENGNMIREQREKDGEVDYIEEWEYDASGNCVRYTMNQTRIGAVTEETYTYDENGNLIKTVISGKADSPEEIIEYLGYQLYYNPYPEVELPVEFTGKG